MLLALTAGGALLPGLAHIRATDPARARSLIDRAVFVTSGLGLLAAIPLVLLSGTITRVAFGASYAGASTALAIVLAALGLFGLTGVAWFALLALQRERTVLSSAVLGLVVSIVLSVLLVRAHGATGAAIALDGGVGALALVLLLGLAGARRVGAAGLAVPLDLGSTA